MRMTGPRGWNVSLPWSRLAAVSTLVLVCAAGAMLTLPEALIATAASPSTPPSRPAAIPILPGEPWIAYSWADDCHDKPQCDVGIWLTRPDGTDRHTITDGLAANQMFPDWSRDGTRIVFVTEWTSLWVSDADGADAEQVYSCDLPCWGIQHPAFSPDGTRVAMEYVDVIDGVVTNGTIVVLDLATGALRTVLQPASPYRQFLEYPRWSPDGRALVVEIERTDADVPQYPPNPPTTGSVIAVGDISGTLPGPLAILTSWDMFAATPDWHPTDDRIVFSTYDLSVFQTPIKAINLHTIRSDGTGPTDVTSFGDHDIRASQPTWTPDGRSIVFTHIRAAPAEDMRGALGVREISFVDPDGTHMHVLERFSATHPRLRPTP